MVCRSPYGEQEYSCLRPLQENARITQLIVHIAQAINDPERKQLKTTVVTDWLIEKGFMAKEVSPEGKAKRVPPTAGIQLGITTQVRQAQHGLYEAVYYSPEAQQFVLDHVGKRIKRMGSQRAANPFVLYIKRTGGAGHRTVPASDPLLRQDPCPR